MSEGPVELAEIPVFHNAAPRITAGSLLRAAREREGLHIAALAVFMKVPLRKLEALEADRLDLLPDAVFVRALAASVCRSLKIDAAPVLELLPTGAPPRLDADHRGINTPFDVPGQATDVSFLRRLFAPPGLMVLALIVAAAIVYFYPAASKDSKVSDTLQAVVKAVTPEVISEAIESPVVPVQSASSSVSVVAMTPMIPDIKVAEAAISAGNTHQDNLLQFKANGTAWVQVTDAKGVQLLSRTLLTGDVVGVNGALPITVVVGRADLIRVELRGKPYDLGAIAQNNVARFEVKQ